MIRSSCKKFDVVDQLKQAIVLDGAYCHSAVWITVHSIGEQRRRLLCNVDQNGIYLSDTFQ